MRPLLFVVLLAIAGTVVAQTPAASSPPEDVVLRWNEAARAAVRSQKTPPPVAARNLALVHVAVYDAVNAVAATHRPFRVSYANPVEADPEAAAAVAAHRTLTELYPALSESLDAVLDETLGRVADGPRKTRGVALGKAVAEDVLAWRANDGQVSRVSFYAPRPAPGRWRATPPQHAPPLLPGWASIRCFAITDPAAFRPPGPPALTSPDYVTAYEQVRLLGGADSAVRTREQTEIAHFWADGDGTVTPPGHWNRIAHSVALQRRTTTAENARLFALLNVAMADAAIVCWECKFRYDFWRPVTAIGEAEPGWMPLLPTPPFPAYTSGHSSFSGSAAAALAAFFGTDAVRFTSTADGLPGVVRSFSGFRAAAEEAGMSRIYGGIHWAFDNADGLACGKEIGEYVAGHSFRPLGDPGLPPNLTLRRGR